jgi:hypothetical protein
VLASSNPNLDAANQKAREAAGMAKQAAEKAQAKAMAAAATAAAAPAPTPKPTPVAAPKVRSLSLSLTHTQGAGEGHGSGCACTHPQAHAGGCAQGVGFRVVVGAYAFASGSGAELGSASLCALERCATCQLCVGRTTHLLLGRSGGERSGVSSGRGLCVAHTGLSPHHCLTL